MKTDNVKSRLSGLGLYNFTRGFRYAYIRGVKGGIISVRGRGGYKRNKEVSRTELIKKQALFSLLDQNSNKSKFDLISTSNG